MAKRKKDSSMDGIIIHYLKKAKCEKSLKLFEEKVGPSKKPKISDNFWNYLKETEKKITRDEDLGFEINFGANQPDKKVSQNLFFNNLWEIVWLYSKLIELIIKS